MHEKVNQTSVVEHFVTGERRHSKRIHYIRVLVL